MRKERIVVLMASVVMATATWAQAVTDKSTVNNGNGSLKVENGKAGNAGLMAGLSGYWMRDGCKWRGIARGDRDSKRNKETDLDRH